MDDNTLVAIRTVVAAVFGLLVFGGLFWAMVKVSTSGSLNASVQVSDEPTWTYYREWSNEVDGWDDDDDCDDWEDERRALRSRLAAALWSNRNVTRQLKASRKTAAFWQGKCAAMEYAKGFVCPTPPVPQTVIDDGFEWRLKNAEAILRTLEGEL